MTESYLAKEAGESTELTVKSLSDDLTEKIPGLFSVSKVEISSLAVSWWFLRRKYSLQGWKKVYY